MREVGKGAGAMSTRDGVGIVIAAIMTGTVISIIGVTKKQAGGFELRGGGNRSSCRRRGRRLLYKELPHHFGRAVSHARSRETLYHRSFRPFDFAKFRQIQQKRERRHDPLHIV